MTEYAEHQIEQLRRIQSVADAALASLELEELLEELLVRIAEALEVDTVAFLLLDEATDDLVARAARGIEVEAGRRIPVGAGFAGRVAAERRPIVVPDVDHADVLNPLLRAKGIKSLLGVPLIVQSNVIGVLHVGSLQPRVFTDEDAELLQLVADRAALAIEHGRMYAAEREAVVRLRRLQAVTDVALTHLSSEELLDELVVRIREILQADTCAILLLDETRNEVAARAAAGLEEEVEAGVRIPVGAGFAGRIAAEARPVFLPDVDHADVLNPILREKGIKSLLGAPLLARGRVLGVIHVGWLTAHLATADETELLQAAAERAALGLERAQLHARLVELDRVRNRFVAIASHELRTPAAAILGSALTLEARAGALSPAIEHDLRALLASQSRRLVRLLEQLLDLSRIEAEALELRPERIGVADLIHKLLGEITPDRREQVQVVVEGALEAELDLHAFERILGNLVLNAFRHGAPPIIVSAVANGNGIELVVEDAGTGVPEILRERLFEQFARGNSTSGTGAGLGLAIARSYAQALGGDVQLEPGVARGARFRVLLPGPPAQTHG